MAINQTQENYAKTALRLPRDLHTALHKAAKDEDRTFNGQIVAMLRASLQPKGPAQ